MPQSTIIALCLSLVLPIALFAADQGPRVVVQQRSPVAQSFEIEIDSTDVGVPLKFTGIRPLVDVVINGMGPYRFILDTGATGGIIDGKLAAELALAQVGEAMVRSPLGEEPLRIPLVMSETVKIGPVRLKDVEWTAMNPLPLPPGEAQSRGIVSTHWFSGILTTVNFADHTITFRPGELALPDGREIFKYAKDAPLPTVPTSVAGVSVDCVLDTGSPGGLTLPSAYVDSLPLKSRPVEVARARTIDAEFDVLGAPLEGDLLIGRHRLEHPEVRFSHIHRHGELGQIILREFVVTFDSSHRRVRLAQGEPEE
jgi:hypothetical protein